MTAWTRDKPTKPGWYWWRLYDDEPWEVVKLCAEGNRLFHVRAGSTTKIDRSKGEWQGPIEPEA